MGDNSVVIMKKSPWSLLFWLAAAIFVSQSVLAVPERYYLEYSFPHAYSPPEVFGTFTMDIGDPLATYESSEASGTFRGASWSRVIFSAREGLPPMLTLYSTSEMLQANAYGIGGGMILAGSTAALEWDHYIKVEAGWGPLRITRLGQGVPEFGPSNLLSATAWLGLLLVAARKKARR